mgnify:CR=1 FL=1
MCIRDSSHIERDGNDCDGAPQPVPAPHGQPGHRVGRGGLRVVGPVSYTHLRAHETVLDLVCRLLLEKKHKKQKTKKTKQKKQKNTPVTQ